jgi:hypothetical protein
MEEEIDVGDKGKHCGFQRKEENENNKERLQ